MTTRKIIIADYDSNWPTKFENEKQSLQKSLTDCFIDCFHIGSTAVPGLAAKPVIDMLMTVSSLEQVDLHQAVLERSGYTVKGENGIPGRRYFFKGNDVREFHIHAYEKDHPDVERHLAFRDYLRSHHAIARQYEAIKKKAVVAANQSPDLYVKYKDAFIKEHEIKALSLIGKKSGK